LAAELLFDALLRDPRPETHERLARVLVESTARAEARERALRLAAELPAQVGEADLEIAASQVAG